MGDRWASVVTSPPIDSGGRIGCDAGPLRVPPVCIMGQYGFMAGERIQPWEGYRLMPFTGSEVIATPMQQGPGADK